MEKVSNQQIVDAGLADWRKLAQALHTRYLIPDYAVAAEFVAAVAQASDADDHRPDLRVTYGAVDVSLCTHEDGLWVTQKDIDMARSISEIASQHGLKAEPAAVTQLEIALDTAHADRIARFWSVLLTGSPANTIYDSVFDPPPGSRSVVPRDRGPREPPPALALRPVACPRGGERTDRRGGSCRRADRVRRRGTVVHRARRPDGTESVSAHRSTVPNLQPVDQELLPGKSGKI